MIPKIIFRRSWIYDKQLQRESEFKMPSDKTLDTFTKKIERDWSKIGPKILSEISRIIKLKWQEKEIVCYITFGSSPFSDPLTINPLSDIHTLTHELIHRFLSESINREATDKNWNKIMQKYKKEPLITKTHIIINAIHNYILEKLFGKKTLQKRREKESLKIPDPDYIRAWEIIDRDGYKNIISMLTNGK